MLNTSYIVFLKKCIICTNIIRPARVQLKWQDKKETSNNAVAHLLKLRE